MELNRADYALLKILRKNNSVSFFKGMTIYEIMSVMGGARTFTYRRLVRLMNLGYVEKGCKDINANTYIITEKGINLIIESEEEGGTEDVEK